MFRKLTLSVVLCLGTLGVSAQVAPPAAEDLNTAFKPMKWRSIGPFRGGRSVAVTGVVGDPKTYYMGTTGGGLWKTDNVGLTLAQRLGRLLQDRLRWAPSPWPRAIRTWCMSAWANTRLRGVMTHRGDGVYRSTDAGKTWKHIGLELTQHIARIVVHPKDPDTVFVAAQGALYSPSPERGVFKSTDGGATWKQRAVRERQDRRRGTVDGRDQPAHPLRGDVGARPSAMAGHQRRARQRPVQVDRQRRDLGEDDRRASPRRWARWRLPSAARTPRRSTP